MLQEEGSVKNASNDRRGGYWTPMSPRRRKRDVLPLPAALDRLERLLDGVRAKVEARRAFTCAGCEAHCCRVGRNAMLVTRLETEAILDRMERDPELRPFLPGIADRLAETAARLLGEEGPELPTFDCPFLGEDNRCLIHGRGQPLGCVTFMPIEGDRCDHREDEFVAAFEELIALQTAWLGVEDREGELIPIAVQDALES